jgi:putative flippase GtrA
MSQVQPMPPAMTRSRLVVLYSIFAAISIAANLGSQKLFVMVAHIPYAVAISVLVGTAVGLAVKFFLDKFWIFRFEHRDIAHGIQSFILYTAMGGATTLIFWGFEFGADHVFGTEAARLTGGGVGLVIGYIAKYWLDKKFVFA